MIAAHPGTTGPSTAVRKVGFLGDTYYFLATGKDTHGRYTMLEAVLTPGGGTPHHLHRHQCKTCYVLNGEIAVYISDKKLFAGPGALVNVANGIPHSFRNETDQPARLLISLSPSGLEEYLWRFGRRFDGQLPPKPTLEEIDRMVEAAPQYGIELIWP